MSCQLNWLNSVIFWPNDLRFGMEVKEANTPMHFLSITGFKILFIYVWFLPWCLLPLCRSVPFSSLLQSLHSPPISSLLCLKNGRCFDILYFFLLSILYFWWLIIYVISRFNHILVPYFLYSKSCISSFWAEPSYLRPISPFLHLPTLSYFIFFLFIIVNYPLFSPH